MATLIGRRKKHFLPSSAFCSAQALRGSGAAHSPWEGKSALLSSRIQVLISLRDRVWPATQVPVACDADTHS